MLYAQYVKIEKLCVDVFHVRLLRLMCFNKTHAYMPKSRHAFIPIGRGLGVVGAGTKKTSKIIRPSGVQCNKCQKQRASYELYIHKPEKKDYEPDKTDYSHYCKGCFEEITKCALCTTKMSTRFCLSCNESYCLTCFKSIHEKGKSVSIDGHQNQRYIGGLVLKSQHHCAANAGRQTFKRGQP